MRKSLIQALLIAIGLIPCISFADDPAPNPFADVQNSLTSTSGQAAPWTKSRFAIDMQTGTRSIGTLDALVPFLGNDDFMIYANLIAKASLDNTFEGNIGLGMRRVNDAETAIYGVYAFYDVLNSVSNNQFTQATVGFERLGLTWDFRTNVYVPLGTTEYNTDLYTGDNGSVIIQGHDWLAYMRTQTEKASPGGDIEVGRTLGSNNVRGYLGAYSFGSTTTGPRLRLEYQYNDRITFTTVGQYDQDRGAQYLFGMRFSVGGAKALNADSIYSRMTDVVVRDIDVVTHESYSPTSEVLEKDRIWVVDTTNGTADGDGTVEHPYNSIAEAIGNASDNAVILIKGPNGQVSSTNALTLKPGQILWGANQTMYWNFATNAPSYTPVAGTLMVQGATGGQQIINGSFTAASGDGIYNLNFDGSSSFANGIVVDKGATNVTIQNVNVTGFTNDGILVEGGSSNVILNNVDLSANLNGLEVADNSNVTLINSRAHNNKNDGLLVNATGGTVNGSNDSFNTNTGNGIENNGGTITLDHGTVNGNQKNGILQNGANSVSSFDAFMVSTNMVDGINITNGSLSLTDGSILSSNQNGLVQSGGTVEMTDSVSNNNTIDGINVSGGNFTGNDITLNNNARNGLTLGGTATTVVKISNAEIASNGGNGIDISGTAGFSQLDGTNVNIHNNANDGINAEVETYINLMNAIITENKNGIEFSDGTLIIGGNSDNSTSISDNKNDGISITGANQVAVYLTNVFLTKNTNDGFAYSVNNPASFIMQFNHVVAEQNRRGLNITAGSYSTSARSFITDSVIADNKIKSNLSTLSGLVIDKNTYDNSPDLTP